MDIFHTERVRQAEDDDALEYLTSRFMVAAAKNEKVLLEAGGVVWLAGCSVEQGFLFFFAFKSRGGDGGKHTECQKDYSYGVQ
jgi:hypothetical protein